PINTFAHPEHGAPGSLVIACSRGQLAEPNSRKSGSNKNHAGHFLTSMVILVLTSASCLHSSQGRKAADVHAGVTKYRLVINLKTVIGFTDRQKNDLVNFLNAL